MKKRFLTTVLLGMYVVMSAFAQMTLSGKVVNVKTGKPIEGANVRLEQTTIGCATNAKGEFYKLQRFKSSECYIQLLKLTTENQLYTFSKEKIRVPYSKNIV